jgi:hypothetical protein
MMSNACTICAAPDPLACGLKPQPRAFGMHADDYDRLAAPSATPALFWGVALQKQTQCLAPVSIYRCLPTSGAALFVCAWLRV